MIEESVPSDTAASEALAQLRHRLQRLHRETGEPSTRELSRSTNGKVSHTSVNVLLKCQRIPRWGQLEALVVALEGDTEEFRQLWIRAKDAVDGTALPQPVRVDPRSAFPDRDTSPAGDGAPPRREIPYGADLTRVSRSELGPMEFIGEGSEGSVYRLTSPWVAGFSQPLAFKEILHALTPEHRARVVDAMEHAVGLRAGMGSADQAELDRLTTWPLAVVEENGMTVGTLMPLIPEDFIVSTQPPDGLPERLVFNFAFLCAPDAYLNRLGVDRSGADDPLIRLALIRELSYAVAFLHRHEIVYGDLSLRHVALAVKPPRVILLDCDAAAALARTPRHQLHSPFFTPPECARGQVLQDCETDVYKLGLCILRGLVSGPGVTMLSDPRALAGILDRAGITLVARTLSERRSDRPSAEELHRYFERAFVSGVEEFLRSIGYSPDRVPRAVDLGDLV